MMTEAWKIDLEGLTVVHEMRRSRRPWVQRDRRSLHDLLDFLLMLIGAHRIHGCEEY